MNSPVDVLAFIDALDWSPEVEAVQAAVAELIEALKDYQQWNPMNCNRDCDLHEQAAEVLARIGGAP